jgi:hypothetical protein
MSGEEKIDPVRVVPDVVWDKVLSQLDPATLMRTKSVSKDWSQRAAINAVKRDDVPIHAKSEELSHLHGLSFVGLFARFWYFAVFRQSTVLFDYVRTHQETARARLMACIRIYSWSEETKRMFFANSHLFCPWKVCCFVVFHC